MTSNPSYIPNQPFFERSTDRFVSRLSSQYGWRAHYYGFHVPLVADRAVVAVPDGTVDILFHCAHVNPAARVCGSVKRGKPIALETGGDYFGVRFSPTAAEPLLGCPLDVFTEREIPLSDVESRAKHLPDLIAAADCFEERVAIFDRYLAAFGDDDGSVPHIVSYMVAEINNANGEIRIQDLAEKTGYTARHIGSAFRKHVGISPKLYIRTVRFQRCLQLMRSQRGFEFADLAELAGYYDQAHFINEFREFSLTTPARAFA
jgi:AraC-like DNA-binding protein